MGATHVMELGCAVLDHASGSAQARGPQRMLTQREESGPGLLAAEALTGRSAHREINCEKNDEKTLRKSFFDSLKSVEDEGAHVVITRDFPVVQTSF